MRFIDINLAYLCMRIGSHDRRRRWRKIEETEIYQVSMDSID